MTPETDCTPIVFPTQEAADAFAQENTDAEIIAEVRPHQGKRFRVIFKDAETGEVIG